MKPAENRFKRAIRSGPIYGCWVGLGQAYAAEIVASAGFDWLLIDGEHAPNTVATILAQLQAVAAYPGAAIVRAVNHDPALIKQLLDIGAETLMIPMVESAEQAEALVQAMRYPRDGFRGMAAGVIRADRWGAVDEYAAHAAEAVGLIVQIESRKGVENAEAIAATEGVDAVFVGPADLSASVGRTGDPGNAEVQALIARALAATHGAGKAAGILAPAADDAERYAAQGFDFIAAGVDVAMLRQIAVTTAHRHEHSAAGTSSTYG